MFRSAILCFSCFFLFANSLIAQREWTTESSLGYEEKLQRVLTRIRNHKAIRGKRIAHDVDASGNTIRLVLQKVPLTNSDWSLLANLPHLQRLDLSNSKIGDSELEFVKKIISLRTLILWNNEITDKGVEHLTELKQLSRLDLGNNSITNDCIAHLARMKNLQSLGLQRNRLNDAAAIELSTMQNLQTLKLCDTQISDDGLESLARLQNLTSLTLADTKVTEQGVTRVASVPGLSWMATDETVIEEFAKRMEAQNRQLVMDMTTIGLSPSLQGFFGVIEITDATKPKYNCRRYHIVLDWYNVGARLSSETLVATVRVQQRTPGIIQLGIDGTSVPVSIRETEAFLERVKVQPWPQGAPIGIRIQRNSEGAISELNLTGFRFRYRDKKILLAFTDLEKVNFSQTNINACQLTGFADFAKLSEMVFDDNRLSNQRIREIGAIKNLKRVSFKKVLISQESLDALRDANPDLEILNLTKRGNAAENSGS